MRSLKHFWDQNQCLMRSTKIYVPIGSIPSCEPGAGKPHSVDVSVCDTVVNIRREGASLEYTRINFGYFLCANAAMRNATLIVFAPSLTPRTRASLSIFSAFRSHATAMPARSKSRTHHSDKSIGVARKSMPVFMSVMSEHPICPSHVSFARTPRQPIE